MYSLAAQTHARLHVADFLDTVDEREHRCGALHSLAILKGPIFEMVEIAGCVRAGWREAACGILALLGFCNNGYPRQACFRTCHKISEIWVKCPQAASRCASVPGNIGKRGVASGKPCADEEPTSGANSRHLNKCCSFGASAPEHFWLCHDATTEHCCPNPSHPCRNRISSFFLSETYIRGYKHLRRCPAGSQWHT